MFRGVNLPRVDNRGDHMRAINRLSAASVKTPKPGKHCDGGGLWLVVREDGGAQWVLRVVVHGRRREMGLGPCPPVGLAEARRLAERWRVEAKAGRDPIKLREAEARAARREDISLEAIALATFEARKAQLKGDGKAGRWMSPLTTHVLPKLGKVPVTDLDQTDLRDLLAPIWHEKADVARKALNRVGLVLEHAAAMGIDVDLQTVAKAKALLGKSRHVPAHIPAMDWRDVPGFYATLGDLSPVELALRLLILTGVRSAPVRLMTLDQITGPGFCDPGDKTDRTDKTDATDQAVWTIPAANMKGAKGKTADFRVPLCPEALRVIDLARAHERRGFLFVGRQGKPISDMAMSAHMKRAGLEARPHGFRAALRTWLAEATDAPHEVAEAVLAHETGSAVVKAYRRTDYLEERRALLQRWQDHVRGGR